MNDDTKKQEDEAVVFNTEDTEHSPDVEYSDDNLSDTVKKLKEKVKTLETEKMGFLTSWQRDKAEFINIRKRDEDSKQEFLKFAKQGIIEEILPVLDSFDMAIGNSTTWESVSKEWRAGVENIYNQFIGILAKNGVTPFGAKGDAFDPNLHHSIATVPTENKDDDHKIAEVLQKGYMMSEKVVRPALVKVFEA